MILWEISLGSLLTIIAVLTTAVGFYYQTLYDSRTFKASIAEIKTDLKVLNKLITDIALQNQRLDNQGERINRIDARLDDMSHGRGFINS